MVVRAEKHAWRVAPCFLVDDVVATAKFYRDKLGFGYDQLWGEPPRFCMVHRGDITVMLCQHAAGPRTNGSVDGPWDAYFWVEDADALSAEFGHKRVNFIVPVGDREYG